MQINHRFRTTVTRVWMQSTDSAMRTKISIYCTPSHSGLWKKSKNGLHAVSFINFKLVVLMNIPSILLFSAADVILWRNKQISAALLAGSTVIWLLFEWIGYYLIPFICHSLILSLATMFLWSNLSFFVNKSVASIQFLLQSICFVFQVTMLHGHFNLFPVSETLYVVNNDWLHM